MNPAGLEFTAGQVAALLGADLIGNPDAPVRTVAPVEPGADGALTFIRSPKFAGKWAESACTAALVTRGIDVPDHDPDRRALIMVDDADLAVIAILEQITPPPHAPSAGVHPSAAVDPSAAVADDARIGPNCVVGPGASVGVGVTLMSGVTIGAQASIGAATLIHPGAVIADRCAVGQRCIIHPNASIGNDGFGYHRTDAGHKKVPHAGIVVVEDDVEIGANTCIDRAKFGATRIGAGSKIDNLVQIGHGCQIGNRCIICAMCGLAGSVTVEDDVVIAGHVGIADSLHIGRGAVLAAKSGVMSDVPAGETHVGYPARKRSITLQIWGAQTRLHKFMRGQIARNVKADEADAVPANSDA